MKRMNEKSFKFTNGKDDNEMLDLKEIFEGWNTAFL
jgi:hypothetical protein